MKTLGALALSIWFTAHALSQETPPPATVESKPAEAPAPPPLPKYPEPETVLVSMKKATAFFRSNLSTAGGYARSWPRDLKESRVEGQAGPAIISIQPHGTTTVGLAMLRAHHATGDPLFLQGAREAGQALMWCQYASGGWGAEHSFELNAARRYHYRRDIDAGDLEPGKRSRRSSLDDNKTQSALRFLVALANTPACADDLALRQALDFAWAGLLAAQASNGGWPQQFSGPADPSVPVKPAGFPTEWSRTFPAVDYTGHHTLNDNNLLHLMELLLEAHHTEKTDNTRFLEAAKRLGDFLVLAQLPEPQPAWAQQYDADMHPAWARKFEPPAVCSVETVGAMEALKTLWLETGDKKYLAPLPAAIAWLERSDLGDGVWARFYELETNRPLYCVADTYELTHDDSNLPTHYGFKVSGMRGDIQRLKEDLSKSREELLASRERQEPDSEKEWSERARKLASKARTALERQSRDGYWISDDAIDAGEYVKHVQAMADYLTAAEKGGATFATLRENERRKEAEARAKEEAEARAKAGAGTTPEPAK